MNIPTLLTEIPPRWVATIEKLVTVFELPTTRMYQVPGAGEGMTHCSEELKLLERQSN